VKNHAFLWKLIVPMQVWEGEYVKINRPHIELHQKVLTVTLFHTLFIAAVLGATK